jgi:hypothetical protein
MGTAHLAGAPVGAAPVEVACTLRGTDVVETIVGRPDVPPGHP